MSHPESARSSRATPLDVAVAAFPSLVKLRVQLSITSYEWTIYPGPPETRWDFVIGFPLELHPFAWDYLKIGSDAEKVTIQPHYRESSWDTFRVDPTGHVTCDALGGLFPFTMGRQPELLKGLRTTIRVLPPLVESDNPDAAKALVEIEAILDHVEMELRAMPIDLLQEENDAWLEAQRQTARGRAAERFWAWRRRRAAVRAPDLPVE